MLLTAKHCKRVYQYTFKSWRYLKVKFGSGFAWLYGRHQLLFACFSSNLEWFFFIWKFIPALKGHIYKKCIIIILYFVRGRGWVSQTTLMVKLFILMNEMWLCSASCVLLHKLYLFSNTHTLVAWFVETTLLCIEIFYCTNLSLYNLTSWQLGDSSLWW